MNNNILDLTSLEKALVSLQRALVRSLSDPADEELRDACIQRFEYSFELSWKMLKRQLEIEIPTQAEVDGYSYRHLIRVAAERGLLSDVEAWFLYRDRRNETSHAYDEVKARRVYAVIPGFAEKSNNLLDCLKLRQADA